MKKTQRYERRLAEARKGKLISILTEYKAEIEREKARQNASHNASHNAFVKSCCQQEIDQLMAEKNAIEAEVVG